MKDWSGMWFFSMQKRCIKETYLVQDFSIVHRILKTLKDRLKSVFMFYLFESEKCYKQLYDNWYKVERNVI